jgi:hypothetical protein
MKIYLARAYTDYGSEHERSCIKAVMERYVDGKIIELPALDKLENELNIKFGKGLWEKESGYFFKLVDLCGVLIITPIENEFNKDGSKRSDKGELSDGVKMEALYGLSIGKKVFLMDIHKSGDERFKEIRGIYDSEELIEEVVELNRYGYLGKYPKIANLMKTEKRLNIHSMMMKFYADSPKARTLMGNYAGGSNRHNMKRSDYVRPIVIQEKYPVVRSPIDYLPYGTRVNYEMSDLTIGKEDNSKYDIADLVGELHFRECIFDTGVKDADLIDAEERKVIDELVEKGRTAKAFEPWRVFNDHVIGACVVFDIDAPHGLEDVVGKVNMFDENHDWYSEFMIMKEDAEKWFKKKGLKCLSSITGNGFNVVGEPYWFEERDDNLKDFIATIEEAVAGMNLLRTPKEECIEFLVRKGSTLVEAEEIYKENYDTPIKCKGVRIDASPLQWHIYKKMIFTHHAKWYRMTFPVSKGIVDKEWLKKTCDLDYFLSDVDKNVDEVIEKSGWRKDIWWKE